MAQQNLDLYYPHVLDKEGKLIDLSVSTALRRAFDFIYNIDPPTGSSTPSTLLLSDVNIADVSASKFTTGMVPAGETLTLERASISEPVAAKLVWEATGQMYASTAGNVLFLVPTVDKTNFIHIGSEATGNTYRWKGINLITRFTGNSIITIKSSDDVGGDAGYRIASATGAVNHVWHVDGADEMELTETALYPSTTNGLNLGSSSNKWGALHLTTPLAIAYGGTALSTTPTNGQLLIGNGTNYTLATLTGTANQVIVTNGSGSITLSLPQSIATTSSPTFANVTVNDEAYGSSWNGSTNVPTKNAIYDKLQGDLSFPIGDHFADAGNVTTVETDLISDTIPFGTLAANGDKIFAEYEGIIVFSATASRQIRLYVGGSGSALVYDSGALVLSAAVTTWNVKLFGIRVSDTVIRCAVCAQTTTASAFPYNTYTEVTIGGSFSGNNQSVRITGQASGVGAATNDIVAKQSYMTFTPVA